MRGGIGIVLVGSMLLASEGLAQERTQPLSPEAALYLEAALDTIQAVTLGADTLPWMAIRDSAWSLAHGARSPSDTYGAIDWALRRANKHSFLQASPPGVVLERLGDRFGYVRVPQRGGAAVALADSLHEGIGRLARAGVCGWIVDLRGNGGGNMWPMLAGVGPLLGDSLVGAFEHGAPSESRWFYRGGLSGILNADGTLDTATVTTVPPVPDVPVESPVAILIDGGTGSSGEAVAIAFHGRPNTRILGQETAGYATANRGSTLPDGVNMVVTTGYYTDRTGRSFSGGLVRPDTTLTAGVPGWPFPGDRASEAARAWLARQPSCR